MPNSYWLKNHAGFKLSEKDMEDIPNPKAELITHVTIKNVQAFGLLGTLVIGPLSAVIRAANRNTAGIIRRSTKCGTVGAALGLISGPTMTMARMKNLEEEAIRDRCYRLRRNRNQVRVDQASILGGVGGAALGVATGSGLAYWALLGMSGGIIGAAAYNSNHGDKHS